MESTISVRKLIYLIFATMLAFSVSLVIVVYLVFQNQQELIDSQETRYESYLLADELRQSSDDLTRLARTYVLTGDSRFEQQYADVLAIRNGDKPRPQHYERIYWDFMAADGRKPSSDGETISLDTLMREAGFTQQEMAKLAAAQANSDELVKMETIAMNATRGLFDDGTGHFNRRAEPDSEMAAELLHNPRYHQEKAKIMAPVNEFFTMLDDRTRHTVDQYIASGDRLFTLLMVMSALLLLFSVLLGWGLRRLVLTPLGAEPVEMASMARRIADGDLAMQFSDNARTGMYSAMCEMTDKLRGLVGNIRQSSDGLAAAAEQTSAVTEQTSINAQQQQQDTDQVAAAINEMASTVQNVAQSTADAADAACSATASAGHGKQVVQQAVTAIEGLAAEVDKASGVIQSLEANSGKISSVIEVIRNIADKTNLLALNAAIEAARAGTQGRGFAVVADEVRTLAEQTQASTQEIEEMIQQLQSGTRQAVAVMANSQTQAQTTLQQAAEADQALDAITDAIGVINDMNTQVASAAEQQVAVTDEINRSITNISEASEQTAVGAKQTAASSAELAGLAEQLREMIAEFRLS
ncbi:methyl-accepting chemotaxis protein [Marinobacterium arenosum]|uniref:methyl-accepting chemotaxis protein n=1 Tax=Marinobacterium arenosum TaxID=2862496 RepID=UPI001C986F1C|nr:methyl-accepting chemotaxis protein [Marinobacterium arenosum]MBY4678318.1 hypothetical protein [Marinobacterium arenosum]